MDLWGKIKKTADAVEDFANEAGYAIGILIITSFILMSSGCTQPNGTNGTSQVNVTELPALTLFADDSTGPETSYTVGRNHRFQVEVKVDFLVPNINFNPSDTGVSIIWIDPQNNNEEFARANLKQGTDNIYTFILRDSELLGLCEPYFYRWSLVYDIVDSGRGVYLGEAQYVMGSKRYTSTGSIQQAMCSEPTSPWGEL